MSEKTINGNTFLGDVILQKTSVDDTTNSGSTTTGALTVAGGVGIQGNLNVGGNITGGSISYSSTSTGTLAVTNTTNATSTTTGVLTVAGGMGVAKDIYAANLRLTQYLNVSGTGVPVATLQANGNGVIGNQAGHYIGNNLYFSGGWQRISTGDPGFCFRLGNSGDVNGNGLQFYVGDTANAPSSKMNILPNGKVGINNTAPSYTLDVTGSFQATTNAIIGNDLTIGGAFQANTNAIIGNDLTIGGAFYGTNVIRKSKVITSTGTTSLIVTDGTLILNNSGGAVTIVLPSASASYFYTGTMIKFINQSGTMTIRNNSNSTTLATITHTNGVLTLLNTSIASPNGAWSIVENSLAGSSTNTSTVACQVMQSNPSGTTNSIPLAAFNNYAGVGSETLFLVGNSLLTNECAQLSFYRGATTADNEIRIYPYGNSNAGIVIKNGAIKIGTGSYFSGYTESSYTPTARNEDNSGVLVYTTQTGNYVKVGKQCTAYCKVYVQWQFPQSGKKIYVKLPFTSAYDFAQTLPYMYYDGVDYYAALVWGYAGTDEVVLRFYDPAGLANPIETLFIRSSTQITQDLDFTLQCTYITT